MPQFSEALIQRLCSEALSVTSEEDVERVLGKLRTALEEHIRLAKESLAAQVTAISALESDKVA